MNEYVEKLLSIISNISIDDIKKYLNIDVTSTLNIWGNYDTFFESQTDYQSELYTFIWICENNVNDLKYSDYKSIGINVYIIGKIGYIKFTKRFISFICKFIYRRSDLNIFTRFYLAFIKAYQTIKRNQFQIEIDKFTNNQLNSNKRIFELFNTKQIDRLYLYKLNTKGTA